MTTAEALPILLGIIGAAALALLFLLLLGWRDRRRAIAPGRGVTRWARERPEGPP